ERPAKSYSPALCVCFPIALPSGEPSPASPPSAQQSGDRTIMSRILCRERTGIKPRLRPIYDRAHVITSRALLAHPWDIDKRAVYLFQSVRLRSGMGPPLPPVCVSLSTQCLRPVRSRPQLCYGTPYAAVVHRQVIVPRHTDL